MRNKMTKEHAHLKKEEVLDFYKGDIKKINKSYAISKNSASQQLRYSKILCFNTKEIPNTENIVAKPFIIER